jgi:hypothetical protein
MKFCLFIIVFITLLAGFAVADHGMDPVPETQGIATSATIDAIGNFASASEIQWRIGYGVEGDTAQFYGLEGIPPLGAGSIYESTYSEDTLSNGVGLIGYDKELDVETSGQITGQWNIEAVKELTFAGIEGARVVSNDNTFLDGASWQMLAEEWVICPFASSDELNARAFPRYCNRVEAGSTIDMTVANVRTTSTDRFVMPSADHPVELNHDIRVSELVTDLPSVGMAFAHMDVLIQEAYGQDLPHIPPFPDPPYMFELLCERTELSEATSVDGDITLFEKLMHYESGMVR